MRITKENIGHGDYYVVHVNPNEFLCDGGKTLPYGTALGTIKLAAGKAKINVWMPAAYTPRGYKSAAKRALEDAAEKLLKDPNGPYPSAYGRR